MDTPQRTQQGVPRGPAIEPGRTKLPSWCVVAGADHAINPDAERAAAKQIGETATEISSGSHAITLSHADEMA
ncbi:hypothetical protein ACFVY1_47340 [Streptomyces sp. NPDC058293]|uniref:hypothetical protein n=1 Tax=Streptomyces sp. NPDC058293 TaxID=3346429 RepID=UPI0036ED9C26